MRALTEGETVTLSATLLSSAGATSDVSGTVTWSSDTPAIVTVSDRGVVTAVGPGNGQIRATLQAISGTATLPVAARARVISGLIHESAPTEQVAVAGATIAVVDGGGTARSVVSDATGHFTVSVQPGAAQIVVSAAGYETTTTAVSVGSDTPALSLPLVPALREVRVSFPSEPPRPEYFVDERTFHLNLHHPGELRAAITSESASHFTGEGNFCIQVRSAGNKVLAQTQGFFDAWPRPIRVDLGIGAYEVKILVCSTSEVIQRRFPPFSVTTFAGEIKHPS